MSQNICNL